MDITTIINIITQYRLTGSELLLVYLTFLAQDEENHPEFFTQWFQNGGKDELRSLFESLKEKGIIHKNYTPDKYVPNDIEFNKNFLKSWCKNSGELGKELFDSYPPFMNIRGKLAPLRNIAKRFNSLQEFFFHYSSTIGHSIEKHKEVLELLEWGKEHNLITYGILEFVASSKYLDIKYLRDNGLESQVADDIFSD